MIIDTVSVQCFIAAAEGGSFTKAAEKVGRTQSAVSQQIAKLENILGKTLFRRGKVLEMTAEGEVFFNYSKQILKLHREALDHFKEPDLKGEVRFGIPDTFASAFLYEVLSEFILVHPNISLHIESDLTLNLFESFKKNKLDLVLLKMKCPKEFEFGADISSDKLCWVGDKNLIQDKEPIPLVLSPKPCVYRTAAIDALKSKNLKWEIAFSSHSHASIVAAVRAGIGLTILPQKMVPKELSITHHHLLPKLGGSFVSLLKSNNDNPAINSFEKFVIKHLR